MLIDTEADEAAESVDSSSNDTDDKGEDLRTNSKDDNEGESLRTNSKDDSDVEHPTIASASATPKFEGNTPTGKTSFIGRFFSRVSNNRRAS